MLWLSVGESRSRRKSGHGGGGALVSALTAVLELGSRTEVASPKKDTSDAVFVDRWIGVYGLDF